MSRTPIPREAFWPNTFTVFSALEKVLVVLGVPIAAYWTYFTFSSNDSQKARLVYETNLAKAKSFGLQIDIASAPLTDHGIRYLRGAVTLHNIGVQYVRIDVSRDTVGAGAIDFAADGRSYVDPASVQWRGRLDLRPGTVKYMAVAPQRTMTIPYVFRLKRHGFYLVQYVGMLQFADGKAYTAPLVWGDKAVTWVP